MGKTPTHDPAKDKKKEDLRKEHNADPDAFKKKYNIDPKTPPKPVKPNN